jgi:hypothetical protein
LCGDLPCCCPSTLLITGAVAATVATAAFVVAIGLATAAAAVGCGAWLFNREGCCCQSGGNRNLLSCLGSTEGEIESWEERDGDWRGREAWGVGGLGFAESAFDQSGKRLFLAGAGDAADCALTGAGFVGFLGSCWGRSCAGVLRDVKRGDFRYSSQSRILVLALAAPGGR